MALERFTKDARAVVLTAAQEVARSRGADAVAAEDLLLALATHPSLLRVGLDRDQIAEALCREEERSLAGVGIASGGFDTPAERREARKPALATSAKLALQRALTAARGAGDRRIQAHHLLLGVLAAEHGRVPRALQLAGIDVAELRTRI
jgi:ATP-dependent Clp protease ATP-binding subunit ClpA